MDEKHCNSVNCFPGIVDDKRRNSMRSVSGFVDEQRCTLTLNQVMNVSLGCVCLIVVDNRVIIDSRWAA